MHKVAIWYEHGGQVCCEYPGDTDAIIRRVVELGGHYGSVEGVPYALDLVKDDGTIWDDPSRLERLSVGIGNGEWVLFYYPADGERSALPLASHGRPNAEGHVVFDFGDETPVSREYLIPRDLAIKTIRSWVDSGELGNFVAWTSNIYL